VPQALVNLDVPDVHAALRFYTKVFGLQPVRWIGSTIVELQGAGTPIFLLQKEAGSVGAGAQRRSYERHWCPVHLDFVVEDLEAALLRAQGAGAQLEQPAARQFFGWIAELSDPWGHGFCLLQFEGGGYDNPQ
jgi:predicted enzyme related to lactoylglutathione lyase